MDGRLPCQGVRWGGVTMIHHQMKTPTDCTSLGDIRGAIDHVDRQIIALLGLRADYVHAAAKFKDSEAAVAAPERQAAMLQARRGWAQREKLDPDFVEKLYGDLVGYFISREMEHWKTGHGSPSPGRKNDEYWS